MAYALKFDGSQNYVDLGKMNGFGGGLGSGFYARFYIKTTGTAAESIGYPPTDFRLTIGLNQDRFQANVSGAINIYLADLDGISLVAGTTTSTGFNDGSVHLVEVTVSGNTLTIAVDGVNKTVNYNVHNAPVRFANFQNDGFMIMSARTLACTIDDLWLGYTATNIYAKYLFGEGSGTTSTDSLGNSTIGVLHGNPLPQWVAPLTPITPKGSGLNLLQVGSTDLSLGQTISEQSIPVTIAYDQPAILVSGKYNLIAPTLTDGQRGDLQTDTKSNLRVVESYRPFGEDTNNDAVIVRQRANWSVFHAPTANTQATTTKAAGSTGIIHVARAIIISVSAGSTAPAAIQLTWNLRDGASGAGNVLATGVIGLEAVAGKSRTIPLSNLWVQGSSATAMTLEFTAAGGANTIEAVTLVGEDII